MYRMYPVSCSTTMQSCRVAAASAVTSARNTSAPGPISAAALGLNPTGQRDNTTIAIESDDITFDGQSEITLLEICYFLPRVRLFFFFFTQEPSQLVLKSAPFAAARHMSSPTPPPPNNPKTLRQAGIPVTSLQKVGQCRVSHIRGRP